MTRHIVARASDIPPGGNKVVSVENRDIVVRCSIAVRMPGRRSTRRPAWRG